MADNDLVTLIDHLAEATAVMAELDLANPEDAQARLEASFPKDGPWVARVRELCREGKEAGWLLDRSAGSISFSRVAKPSDTTNMFSIDAVLSDAPGLEHHHPFGEVNLCLVEQGEPTFDSRPPGWAVFAPRTTHVPAVENGQMLLLYFLPEGKVDWKRAVSG